MVEMNGIDRSDFNQAEEREMGERDQARIAAREPVTVVQETLAASDLPFDQKAHDLLIRGIDQVATDWVHELKHTRENSKRVEQMVLERATKVKADITALYLLGSAALAEARRGDDINERLAAELDKLAEERAA
ncbi:hypothetical protein JQ604_14860 [Bradyrhizobium jicamae]|uniref:hypothetical protein n=1 Tax=Bradyrhizobium jicamae TaxID=280332 RepID=UPI001BA7AAFD|nr:hypothetical protein [Bradyrhizobium jicamae]MBR0753466.1 hypothetical protein [Bradyrhizobium jicamae]